MKKSKCYTAKNGDTTWRMRGKLHREDGPALEGTDGYKAWCMYGKLHRLNGPAVEFANGETSWYLNGVYCQYHEYLPPVREQISDEEYLVLILTYGTDKYPDGFVK